MIFCNSFNRYFWRCMLKHAKRQVNTVTFFNHVLSICSVCNRCLFSFPSEIETKWNWNIYDAKGKITRSHSMYSSIGWKPWPNYRERIIIWLWLDDESLIVNCTTLLISITFLLLPHQSHWQLAPVMTRKNSLYFTSPITCL